MFGLSVDTLRNIREVFARFPSIEKILLYGSRAKGNYKTGSDIDITLIGKNLNLNSTSSLLRDALDQLYLPYTFDISIFNQLDEPAFIDHILRVGKTFYKREIPGLPKGWEMKVLGEICDIYQPKTISKKEMLSEGEYPVFGANGIIGRYYKYNHEDPQLLITCRGATCGSVNVSQSKSWITGNAMVIRPTTNDLSLRFLEYIFRGNFDVSSVITGAAQPQITRKSLAPVAITFPQLAEQKRIVAILDKAFAAIDTAVANTQKNLANARELFESQLEYAIGMDAVNREGEEAPIGQMTELLCGFAFKSKEYREDSHFLVRIGNVQDGYISKDNPRFVKLDDKTSKFALSAGDFLISLTGNIGRVARVEEKNLPAALNQRVARLRVSKPDQIDAGFLYLFLRSSVFRKRLVGAGHGAAQQNVSPKTIPQVSLFLPPLPEQKRIVKILDKVSASSAALVRIGEQKLVCFAELKQSLLHKTFCGEL